MNAKTVAEIRTRLSRFAADQQAVGKQVAGFKPPQDAEADNADLARGFRDTAAEARAIFDRLAGVKTVKAAFAILSRQSPRAKAEVDHALLRLDQKGYRTGG